MSASIIIKKLRKQRKLSQKTFGSLVGVDLNTVSRWERGWEIGDPVSLVDRCKEEFPGNPLVLELEQALAAASTLEEVSLEKAKDECRSLIDEACQLPNLQPFEVKALANKLDSIMAAFFPPEIYWSPMYAHSLANTRNQTQQEIEDANFDSASIERFTPGWLSNRRLILRRSELGEYIRINEQRKEEYERIQAEIKPLIDKFFQLEDAVYAKDFESRQA